MKKNIIIGGWKLIELLGSGGNGEVWACTNINNDIEAAIKILRKDVTERQYKRFVDEVTFMNQYQRVDGVLPVLDKNIPLSCKELNEENLAYIVMPRALTLKQQFQKLHKFEERINAIKDILEMLHSLHCLKVAHRDIKPANILYYNGQYVLSDFGLVFFQDMSHVTKNGERIGAKRTLAPEMEREGAYLANPFKADIYSIGKTIWMILMDNDDCFEGQYRVDVDFISINETCIKHQLYSGPLERLLQSCTEHDPAKRPTADEVLSGFNKWMHINSNMVLCIREQWKDLLEKLFPLTMPQTSIWHSRDDMIKILNMLCKYRNLNHTFFPDAGGLDMKFARPVPNSDMIEINLGLPYYITPRELRIEIIDTQGDAQWNYVRIELEEMEPLFDKKMKGQICEECVEISPQEYGPYDLLEFPEEYEDRYVLQAGSRSIAVLLKGVLVIFCKMSEYNFKTSTYDARHNKMSAIGFRNYIEECHKYGKII